MADAEDALMDDAVFFGNTALVFGVLVAIFVVHVAIISAVEAYWLAQVRDRTVVLKRAGSNFHARVNTEDIVVSYPRIKQTKASSKKTAVRLCVSTCWCCVDFVWRFI